MLRQETYVRGGVRAGKAEALLLSGMSVLCLLTLFKSIAERNVLYILATLASLLLIYAPLIVENVFQLRMSFDLKLIFMTLAICGPMLGNVYKLYYTVPYWDKGLHALSGLGFAAFGYLLPELADRKSEGHSPLMKCLCAFCVSLTVAALWEFFEYGSDMLLATDMQNDTIIDSIASYSLGGEVGVIGSLNNITSVSVNGETMPYAGYLDIGLIDTMNDMLVCSLGAIVFIVYACVRRRSARAGHFCEIALLRDLPAGERAAR